MDKRSVGLKKLFIDGIRYWFLIILVGILGAVGGWKSTVSYNQNVDKEIAAAEEKKKKAEEYAAYLAQDEVEVKTFTRKECEETLKGNALKDVLDTYAWYQGREMKRDYMESSLYLTMEPYDFNALYLEFRVIREQSVGDTAAFADQVSFNSYIHALRCYVIFNGLVDDLIEQKNLDVTARALSEMISINDGGKDFYDDYLLITVYQSPTTEALTDDIVKAFIAYGDELAKNYPGLHLELGEVHKANYYNSGLNSAIETQRQAVANDQSKIDASLKKLNSMQIAYYNMLVNGTDEESVTEVVVAGQVKKKAAATEEEELPTKRRLLPMLLIGGVAGVVVAFVLIFFANLLSGKLLFLKDFSGIYGVKVLGAFHEKKKSGISGKLVKAEYPEAEDKEDPAYLYLALRETCRRQEIKDAVIVSTGSLDQVAGIGTLVEKAKKDGISLSIVDAFPKSSDDAEKLLDAGGVVLAEAMHKTRLRNMDKVMTFCKENGVNMLGAVGIVNK